MPFHYNCKDIGFHQELTSELSKLKIRGKNLKLTSEPPLLLDIENNEMHKVTAGV